MLTLPFHSVRPYWIIIAFFCSVIIDNGEAAIDLGCFITEPGSRIAPILQQEVTKETATQTACISTCQRKQLPYAGLESGNECYCGTQIPSLQSKTLSKECNVNCAGNAKQTCGGRSRMHIFRIDSIPLTTVNIANSIYIGCYNSTNEHNATLFRGISHTIDTLSPSKCHHKCYEDGWLYFALSQTCTCGDKHIILKNKVPHSSCSNVCPGDNKKTCGGAGYISLYATGIIDLPITSNYLLGCYNEQFAGRVVSGYKMTLQSTNSPRRCVNICKQRDYPYAAVKNQFCYCSEEIPKENAIEEYSGCVINKCVGDELETCGGPDRIKIFSTTNPVEGKQLSQDSYGCFADDRRYPMMGDVQRTFASELIGEDCSEVCRLRGYAFSGGAKNDCFCGHNIPSALSKLTRIDCDSPCFKQSPFPCGNRIPFATYTTGLSTKYVQDIPSSIYIGCYRESSIQQNITRTRLLNGYVNYYIALTPELCHKMCFKEGHLYYGLSDERICYCGDATPDPDSLVPDSECNINCPGDANYKCGGNFRTAISTTGITNIPTLNRYVGCYQDEGDGVVLSELKIELSRTNTPRRCLNICDVLGYRYAGVHSKRFCQCGNEKPAITLVADSGSCAYHKCVGNWVETCGGPDGITKVFRTTLTDTSRIAGYIGCYANQPVNNLLPDIREVFVESLVPNYCLNVCTQRGFAFAGLSKGTECYCGYYSPSLISKAGENECSSPCSGNKEVFCGGKQQLSVYFTGVQTTDIDASVYLGCYREDPTARTHFFFEKRLLSGFWMTMDVTREMCHVVCHREGFLYFAMTEKYYCFCGDKKPTSKVRDNECSESCNGDVNQKCGAESRFNVYQTGITDFNTVGRYIGCYKDPTGIDMLKGLTLQLPATNTPMRCSNICAAKGYAYFGLRIGMECHCGNESPSNSRFAGDVKDCDNKKCPGDRNVTCGSRRSIKIYQVKKPSTSRECDPRYDDCDASRPNPVEFHPVEELTTTVRPDSTDVPVEPPSPTPPIVDGKTCQIPSPSAGRTCTVHCADRSDCSNPGSQVSAYTDISCTCNMGYVLSTENNRAYCINGGWFPKLPECAHLCPVLTSASLNFISCTYGTTSVPCTEPARPETTVRIACKPTYTPEDPALVVRSVTCLPDGTWDHALYKCRPECGEAFAGSVPLLVGGRPAQPNEAPWHVAIYRKRNPNTGQEHQYICGGTIMSPVLIISAAHCFYDRVTNRRYPSSDFELAVGKYTVSYDIRDFPETTIFNISRLHIPESFYGEEVYYASDIALLELDETITMSSKLMPVCIDWSGADTKPPANGTVAGWGLIENSTVSEVLRVAELPFITQQECRLMVSESFRKFVSQPDKFCSGSLKGAGARQGDSGGGWTFKRDSHYFIYGIVSFKETIETSVATFTSITSHLDWMEKIRKQILHTRGL